MPWLALHINVLLWGQCRFPIKFLNSGTSRSAWNRHWRSSMVDTGILSCNRMFSFQECEITFWTMKIYNDTLHRIRLWTKPWPYYRTWPFTIMQKVYIDICDWCSMLTGVLTSTSPDNWSRPIFIRPSSDGTYYGMVMSVRVSVRPTLRPGLRPPVFRSFLLHALPYWAEILHMTLFYGTTDQVWVSSLCVNFRRSYASL